VRRSLAALVARRRMGGSVAGLPHRTIRVAGLPHRAIRVAGLPHRAIRVAGLPHRAISHESSPRPLSRPRRERVPPGGEYLRDCHGCTLVRLCETPPRSGAAPGRPRSDDRQPSVPARSGAGRACSPDGRAYGGSRHAAIGRFPYGCTVPGDTTRALTCRASLAGSGAVLRTLVAHQIAAPDARRVPWLRSSSCL
jgi:hypothetical protein